MEEEKTGKTEGIPAGDAPGVRKVTLVAKMTTDGDNQTISIAMSNDINLAEVNELFMRLMAHVTFLNQQENMKGMMAQDKPERVKPRLYAPSGNPIKNLVNRWRR